ncbi:MAG: GDP-mannose mannosyl hydrolase [Mariprofundaceae bacterium]|nr:GDP-mannose mannosyl hydrolase [Mariprofundaceae bacterium]
MLSKDIFKMVIEHAPLFAMDLVIINDEEKILLGKRSNNPAKGFWFVPGGRVFKNESLDQAFRRISSNELGVALKRSNGTFLGLFEHFYDDSVFGSGISTHYINATHALRANIDLANLPQSQHQEYVWMSVNEMQKNDDVHQYSKVFLSALNGV